MGMKIIGGEHEYDKNLMEDISNVEKLMQALDVTDYRETKGEPSC